MAREQVRGLVLVDGGPGLDPDALRHIRQQFLKQPWSYDSIDSFATELQRQHTMSDLQFLQGIAKSALRPLPSGWWELKCDKQLLRCEHAHDEALLWEKLRSFEGLVLVIRGHGSAVLGGRAAARMAYKLPDCRLHTVPGAGHGVILDNPDDLLLAIERFLSEISRELRAPEKVGASRSHYSKTP
jgi:pimeloyl-ACP methyl ester carboxylesterase